LPLDYQTSTNLNTGINFYKTNGFSTSNTKHKRKYSAYSNSNSEGETCQII
jgi:hypothetical protein